MLLESFLLRGLFSAKEDGHLSLGTALALSRHSSSERKNIKPDNRTRTEYGRKSWFRIRTKSPKRCFELEYFFRNNKIPNNGSDRTEGTFFLIRLRQRAQSSHHFVSIFPRLFVLETNTIRKTHVSLHEIGSFK